MPEIRRLAFYSEEGMTRLYKEHERIFIALKERDAEKAQKEMRTHIESVEKVLSKYIE